MSAVTHSTAFCCVFSWVPHTMSKSCSPLPLLPTWLPLLLTATSRRDTINGWYFGAAVLAPSPSLQQPRMCQTVQRSCVAALLAAWLLWNLTSIPSKTIYLQCWSAGLSWLWVIVQEYKEVGSFKGVHPSLFGCLHHYGSCLFLPAHPERVNLLRWYLHCTPLHKLRVFGMHLCPRG